MGNQRGITLIGMIVACIVVVIVAIGGLKIAPAYIEYFKVKKAIVAIAQTRGATVAEVRQGFDRRAAIDDIDVIMGRDLEVTKEGNDLVVSFAYTKRIPLFANINVVIDFAASSNE
jgi:type II secretory pathway pseudopilin PulG